eukprot:302602-Chlamydomonas_euryale.AAC.5
MASSGRSDGRAADRVRGRGVCAVLAVVAVIEGGAVWESGYPLCCAPNLLLIHPGRSGPSAERPSTSSHAAARAFASCTALTCSKRRHLCQPERGTRRVFGGRPLGRRTPQCRRAPRTDKTDADSPVTLTGPGGGTPLEVCLVAWKRSPRRGVDAAVSCDSISRAVNAGMAVVKTSGRKSRL